MEIIHIDEIFPPALINLVDFSFSLSFFSLFSLSFLLYLYLSISLSLFLSFFLLSPSLSLLLSFSYLSHQVCQLAEKLNVRMVIVGSHGKGAIRRALLGSVSTYLTQHCTRPVLVVRD